MSRCRQCFERFLCPPDLVRPILPGGGRSVSASESVATTTTAPSEHNEEVCGDSIISQDPEDPRYTVTVTGILRTMPVMFELQVRRGDALWVVRRRYQQVLAVHSSLIMGLGRAAHECGLPRPPPKLTLRSVLKGRTDRRFLEERAGQIEQYVRALLVFIPCVEQCEALYKFLCYVNLPRWDTQFRYGQLAGGGAPPVAIAAIAKLPKVGQAGAIFKVGKDSICVICQDTLDPDAEDADIRKLPCGHEFHFSCISGWLQQRNTCCICQDAAVLSAPRLTP
mmetsp:Transcript_116765/g.337341  ORF Transcript_116765/g.337341 Transcript_116765/m.337341 type:complete len:280 (-) Transcript_116765:108-947(-)